MESALETFLKTAIVIDDSIGAARAFDGDEATKQAMTIEPSPAGVSDVASASTAGGTSQGQKAIDFNKIADGFCEKGIICGLYNPRDVNAETQKKIRSQKLTPDLLLLSLFLAHVLHFFTGHLFQKCPEFVFCSAG